MKNKLHALVLGLSVAGLQTSAFAATYGPTAVQETLWSIAYKLPKPASSNTQQMMLAIRAKNPQAFASHNINTLKHGSILQLPSSAELQQWSRPQALQLAHSQNTQWLLNKDVDIKHIITAKPAPKMVVVNVHHTQTRLKREINHLKTQLKHEQARSAQLANQLHQLQNATPSRNGVTSVIPANNQEITQLKTEITELKASLDEKDTHIQNLQSSLRQASETIKKQYTENQGMFDKLKTLDPSLAQQTAPPAVPPSPSEAGKPGLTLVEVEKDSHQPITSTGKPPVFTDQLPQASQTAPANSPQPNTTSSLVPSNTATSSGVPLKNVLEAASQQDGQTNSANTTTNPNPNKLASLLNRIPTPSRISFIVALLSLLFILGLLWRSFRQRKYLQKEIAILKNPSNDSFHVLPTESKHVAEKVL